MNRKTMLAVVALGGATLCMTTPAGASTVTCESTGGDYKACPVDTSGGVLLTRQLSSQGCWQDDSWGYDSNKIWVTHGCRAQFEVGKSPAKSSSSSNGGAIAAAAVVGLAAAAIIANNNDDHHDHHKNNNYNNNYDRNYDDRYDYDRRYRNYDDPNWNHADSRYGYNGYDGNPRHTFTCESHGSRTAYCDMPWRGHPEIYKQLSSTRCSYGRNWGVEHKRVWVDGGCRAVFAVY